MDVDIDLSLPDEIEKNSQGGLEWLTSAIETPGRRQTVRHRAVPMGAWDIAYGLRLDSDLIHPVQALHAYCGIDIGFGFKDPLNYQAPNYWHTTGQFQTIGTGDGSSNVFQAVKTFEPFPGRGIDKPIRFLDKGTVAVRFDGNPVAEGSEFTVDHAAGTIAGVAPTWSAANMNGVVVSIQANFHFPVYFTEVKLPVSIHTRAGQIPQILIAEVPY